MTNAEVARVFLRIAELMSYREEGTFKVRAYYKAALVLGALPEPLSDLAARGELEKVEGVGEAISGKIAEILDTGTCALYERLNSETPEGVRALLRVSGLTPRLVRLLVNEFQMESVEAFITLAGAGGLADLESRNVKVEEAGQMLRAAEGLNAFGTGGANAAL